MGRHQSKYDIDHGYRRHERRNLRHVQAQVRHYERCQGAEVHSSEHAESETDQDVDVCPIFKQRQIKDLDYVLPDRCQEGLLGFLGLSLWFGFICCVWFVWLGWFF